MDDLISRRAAIDAMKDMYRAAETWLRDATDDVTKARAESCMASFVEIKLRTEKLSAAQPDHTADISKKAEGDCVSRQMAIDAMKDALDPHIVQFVKAKMAKVAIEALPSAQPGQRWIPCSERLPYAEYGESDNVLATCGYRDVEDGSIRWIKTLYFNGGNWCHPTGETYLEKVYAWMPLPEPYQGGEKE